VKEVREIAEILFLVSLTVLDFEIRRDYCEKRDIKYLEFSLFSIFANERDYNFIIAKLIVAGLRYTRDIKIFLIQYIKDC